MSEQRKTTGNPNQHAIILTIFGVVLLITGIIIATVPGTHLRGSGLGTAGHRCHKVLL
jgi:hypothetical protein